MQGFSILCRGLQYFSGVYNISQGLQYSAGFSILCRGLQHCAGVYNIVRGGGG